MKPSPLVDAAWLEANASRADVRIVDCRYYLSGKRGEDEYLRGHIPGAVFADLDRDLASPKSEGTGRHPLPTKEGFRDALARLGVARETIVVAYDDAGGSIAARLWWLLRHFGHVGGRVLDGGLQAWSERGLPLAPGREVVDAASPLDLVPSTGDMVDKAAVDALRSEPTALVIDARAAERYEGRVEPIDARAGHIPGAISAPFAENLVAVGGRLRSPVELAERFRALGAFERARVVCYCGSGVTACHDVLALTLAGRDDAELYVGSWSEWSSDPSLPVATGSEP